MSQNYANIRNHLITYSDAADQTVFTDAHGVRFTDENGNTYINMNDISCALGYAHPGFQRALGQLVQTHMLGHPGTLSQEKELLIENFMRVTHRDFDKIFFAASGGEVVDWSIKVARRHTGKDGIISFRNALHGRSFAGAYISGTPARKEDFGSGLEHIFFWDYPEDGRSQEPTADTFSDIAAVIIEPYQALGGMVSPTKEYWRWLREYTRANNILLILDEIQTGFGKTGSFFAYEESGIVPDILLAGKGMSNGFGLGALLMTKEVGTSIRPHELSGGSADNDLMCGIVNTVFSIYQEEDILRHVTQIGALLRAQLEEILADNQLHGKVHGKGLFLSLELPGDLAGKIAAAARSQGVFFGRSGNKLMLRPPLVLTEEDAQIVCSVIRKNLQTVL